LSAKEKCPRAQRLARAALNDPHVATPRLQEHRLPAYLSVSPKHSEDALGTRLSQVVQHLRQPLRRVGCVNGDCKVLRQLGGCRLLLLLLALLGVKEVEFIVDNLAPA
jgi:hypothetical protein